MKLLIIGASGVLGSRLYNDAIKKKWNVLGTYCSHECGGLFYLDVRDKNSIEKIFRFFEPEAVVMAGGITDVDLCEIKQKLTVDVNIKGTKNLAKRVREYDSKLMYVSTDYVFDGERGPYSEAEKTNPINFYGKTKLEAENIVKNTLKDYLIVRTSQLYGIDYSGRNFIVKIIYNMKNNKKVYAADDFYSTPTYAGSLSEIIIKLIEKDKKGLYHGAGAEFIDRYSYVNKIADIFKLDKNLIHKVTLRDLPLKALRPKRGGLKVDKIKEAIDINLLNCKSGLILFKKEFNFSHSSNA